MKLAVLIPVHNNRDFTISALNDLLGIINKKYKEEISIVVIDDGSTDGTYTSITKFYPEIKILKGDGNLWWSGAINLGAKYAIEELKSEFILLWNNDITFKEDYFSKLRSNLIYADINTIIGSKILIKNQPEIVWSMGGRFNNKNGKYHMFGYYQKDSEKYCNIAHVDWLTGMGTVVPKSIIEDVGYWDQQNFPQYHGDSDFTYRAKLKGYNIIVNPELIIYNSVENSGMEHNGNMRQLIKMMTDIRSKTNFKKNYTFYKKYSKSTLAYYPFILSYLKLFGGFLKWNILHLFGCKKKKLVNI